MIVLDSSVLVAYFNSRDGNHAKAKSLLESVVAGTWGKAILLEYVFLETVTVLKLKYSPLGAIQAGEHLRRVHQLDFLPSSDLFRSAWKEFQSDQTTRLSFVDHAIAIAARQRAGGKVLTFDDSFRQLPGITVEPVQ